MSKITMSLLKKETESWLNLKKSLNIKSNNTIQDFGKYMNNKYAFKNEILIKEKDYNTALLLIIKEHVQEIK